MINRFNKHNPEAKEVKPAFAWMLGMEVASYDRRNERIARLGKITRLTKTQIVVDFGAKTEERFYLNGIPVGSSAISPIVVPTEEQKIALANRLQESVQRSQEHEQYQNTLKELLAPLDGAGSIIENSNNYELTLFIPKEKIRFVIEGIAKILGDSR